MYSTSSKLNEIILLNRKLRNALSFRGGSTRKLQDFKGKLIQNKLSILYLYISCFFTILYLCYISLPQNKRLLGGAQNSYNSFSDILSDVKNKSREYINQILTELYKILNDLHNQLLKITKKTGGPVVDTINKAIGGLDKIINTFLYSTPLIPWAVPMILILVMLSTINYLYALVCLPLAGVFIAVQVFVAVPVPVIPITIVYLVLIYIVCMFLIDSKIYLPCYGCEEGTSFYKCLPGTGKGSVGCTIYTEFLRKIKVILKSITAIKTLIINFKKKIVGVFNKIINFVFLFGNLLYRVFGSSIEKIFDALRFLRRIEIPDEWGFNFGEFIICPDFSTKGLNCIYNKDGSLRNRHGNNPIFHTFWKMIRVILETPPPIPKFKIDGGAPYSMYRGNTKSKPFKVETTAFSNIGNTLSNFSFDNISVPNVQIPNIENLDINILVESENKNNTYDKDLVYKKLLETLIKIEINPIKWIAALFNLLIDAINFIIEKNIQLLNKMLSFIFALITEAVKGMTNAFASIINLLLKPLNEVANIALKLPKQLFKAISKIFEIGPFTIITFYFYQMLTSIFPFLNKLRSFIIIITIVIIIQGILFVCPMIGGLYAFYVPFMYVYGIYSTLRGYIQDQRKILADLNNILIENNTALKEIKDFVLDLDDYYKIIIGVFIFILIIFIVLNLFTDFNRRFTEFIIRVTTRFIYGHYYNKFSAVQKKFMKFKLQKEIQKEKENKSNNVNAKSDNKKKEYIDRLNYLRNLNFINFNNIN